jgi:hypothetical protein
MTIHDEGRIWFVRRQNTANGGAHELELRRVELFLGIERREPGGE